jgi:hypothetical protein
MLTPEQIILGFGLLSFAFILIAGLAQRGGHRKQPRRRIER